MIISRFCTITLVASAPAVMVGGRSAHVITGHVYDVQHRPIAHALVGVRSHLDLLRLLMTGSMVRSSYYYMAGVFVRTGVDGAFRVDVPAGWGAHADSGFDIVALVPDFAPSVSQLPAGLAAVDVTLTSAPWNAYTIRVQTPDGRPAATAVARAVVGVGDSVVGQAAADVAGQMSFRAPTTVSIPVVVSTPGYRPVEVWPFQYGDATKAAITVTLLPVMTGVVRDEHGRPAAGIGVFSAPILGLAQTVDAWKSQLADEDGAVTDASGRYTLASPMPVDPEGKRLGVQSADGSKFNVVFADSEFTQLAFRQIDPTPPPGAAIIVTDVTLRPTRAVRIPILEPPSAALAVKHGNRTFSVGIEPVPTPHAWEHDTASPMPIRMARIDYSDSGQISTGKSVWHESIVRLLPGRYRVVARRWPGLDVNAKGAWFDVPVGSAPLTTLEQRPPLLPIYAMLGKRAPELHATDLDGTPARLADYRGKVVVLDFWGYWCGACIQAMKEEVIPFAGAYVGKPVVVLALHDASVRSRAEYDSVFRRLERAEFGGRDLPFPVLLDRPTADQQAIALGDRTEGNGETVAAYNVTGFPSTFVIDARGILAERVDLTSDPAQLRRVVDRLLGEAAGPAP